MKKSNKLIRAERIFWLLLSATLGWQLVSNRAAGQAGSQISSDRKETGSLAPSLALPAEKIRASLMAQTGLIKTTPVLGGKMAFYNQQAIHILSDRWVLAEFEDGHQRGLALLAYSADKSGQLQWKLIDSYLP